MSFCPLCNEGQGNGGSPCHECEAREARRDKLDAEARQLWSRERVMFGPGKTCYACGEQKPRLYSAHAEERLCIDCYAEEYVENEL